jgi:hypothetical protein
MISLLRGIGNGVDPAIFPWTTTQIRRERFHSHQTTLNTRVQRSRLYDLSRPVLDLKQLHDEQRRAGPRPNSLGTQLSRSAQPE